MENEMFNPMFRPHLFEVSRVLWWALTILPNWFPISGCNLFGQITHSLVSSTDIHIGKCDRGFCNFSEPCWPFLNILNGNARALVIFQRGVLCYNRKYILRHGKNGGLQDPTVSQQNCNTLGVYHMSGQGLIHKIPPPHTLWSNMATEKSPRPQESRLKVVDVHSRR